MAIAALHLGLVHFWCGRASMALTSYDEALALPISLVTMARLQIAKGACLHEAGRHADAAHTLTLASALAEQADDDSLRARAERGLMLLHAWSGPSTDARTHGERAIELATRIGDQTLLWSTHWGMAVHAGLTGNADDVALNVATCERIADELGSPVLVLATAEVAIEYASGTGAWDEGITRAATAISDARSLGARSLLPRLLVWSALMRIGRGEYDTAAAELDEAWQVASADDRLAHNPHTVIPAHTGRAAYWLALGEYERAIEIASAGLALADASGYVAWGIHRLLPILGEATLWIGDFDRAEALSRRMRRDAAALGHRLGLAWADACDALLVLLRDHDAARAIPLLSAAADALDAIPFPEYAARVRRQLASALRDVGDIDGAKHELRRAHDALIPMHAEGALAGIRQQLRECGARPPSIIPPRERVLTGREAQIAKLVAAHKTNAEIGVALGVSPRTVSTHLSNIFGKLGVRSRGELADVMRGLPPLDARA